MVADDAARIEQLEAEVRRLREQEAATAEVLRVLASSPSDLQSVLDTVVQSAMRLSRSTGAALRAREGDDLHMVARAGDAGRRPESGHVQSLTLRTTSSRAVVERRAIHLQDRSDPSVLAEFPDLAFRGPYSTLTVPLLRDGDALGTLDVIREPIEPYSPREIALVETFANQAVIAISNARLFDEREQRNAELQESNRQVTEALEQQSATADILRVIASSPTDLQPVLDAVAVSAARLCAASDAFISLLDGDLLVPKGFWASYSQFGKCQGIT